MVAAHNRSVCTTALDTAPVTDPTPRTGTARFDDLVTQVYRAATGGASWEDALREVAHFFDAGAAVLHTYDLQHGRLLHLNAGGTRHEILGDALYDYTTTYGRLDPRKGRALAAGAEGLGRWFHCHEAFDPGYVARDRSYQHYILPYGVRYNANVTLPITPTIGTAFVLELNAGRGPLDPDERELARRLGQQLQEALHAHERMRHLLAQALAGHGLLEAFAHPMWLLDGERFILHANRAARAAAATDHAAVERDGRLQLRRDGPDRDLALRLAQLVRGPHGERAVVDARLRPGDPPTWLHLLALEPQAVLGAFGTRPLVVATLFDPSRSTTLDPRALADLFGLTPAEARVATLIAEGVTADVMAARLGCAESTVRTHIRNVLGKLGARRVVDAVRLLRQGEALWAAAAPG